MLGNDSDDSEIDSLLGTLDVSMTVLKLMSSGESKALTFSSDLKTTEG